MLAFPLLCVPQLDRDAGDLYRVLSPTPLPPTDGWLVAVDGKVGAQEALAVLAVAVPAVQVDAWGNTGHRLIGVAAMRALPDDLPAVDLHRWNSDCVAFDVLQEKRRPMLGICYGMQFINARLGGTLFADVQAQLGVAAHSPKRTQGVDIMHDVSVETGSLLADLVEASSAPANSFHLQAVENVGEGLRVNARAADGLIEGIEEEEGRLLGVQFHPEAMPGSAWDSLFAHLVRQASL